MQRALHLTRKGGILYQNAWTFLSPWLIISVLYLPAPTGSKHTTLKGPILNYWHHSVAFLLTRDSQRRGKSRVEKNAARVTLESAVMSRLWNGEG